MAIVTSHGLTIFTRFLKEISWKPKGSSKSSNLASNIAGNCVAEPSTLSKFPAKRSKIAGNTGMHPHLAIILAMLGLLGILPGILRAVFNFSAILLAISVIFMKKLIINLQKGEIKC